MKQVDFYVLKEPAHSLDLFACRLLAKAYQQQCHAYVHVVDESAAAALNQLLWTFDEGSFIPHSLYPERSPIQIGYSDSVPEATSLLINLTYDVPTFSKQFQRIIEIVPEDDTWKLQSRKKYQYYRSQDWQLTSHQL